MAITSLNSKSKIFFDTRIASQKDKGGRYVRERVQYSLFSVFNFIILNSQFTHIFGVKTWVKYFLFFFCSYKILYNIIMYPCVICQSIPLSSLILFFLFLHYVFLFQINHLWGCASRIFSS